MVPLLKFLILHTMFSMINYTYICFCDKSHILLFYIAIYEKIVDSAITGSNFLIFKNFHYGIFLSSFTCQQPIWKYKDNVFFYILSLVTFSCLMTRSFQGINFKRTVTTHFVPYSLSAV